MAGREGLIMRPIILNDLDFLIAAFNKLCIDSNWAGEFILDFETSPQDESDEDLILIGVAVILTTGLTDIAKFTLLNALTFRAFRLFGRGSLVYQRLNRLTSCFYVTNGGL